MRQLVTLPICVLNDPKLKPCDIVLYAQLNLKQKAGKVRLNTRQIADIMGTRLRFTQYSLERLSNSEHIRRGWRTGFWLLRLLPTGKENPIYKDRFY
jgi:hypothetical protein